MTEAALAIAASDDAAATGREAEELVAALVRVLVPSNAEHEQ